MIKVTDAPKSELRLSIRATSTQKNVLARAATARHMNISQFVLGASLREAEQIISVDSRVMLSGDEYDWLVKFMDEPNAAPQLREAFRQKLAWDA